MTKTYIFDRDLYIVQHVSDKTDHMEALREFDSEAGIDPLGIGLNLSDWAFVDADADLAARIDEWTAKGNPSDECPEELLDLD